MYQLHVILISFEDTFHKRCGHSCKRRVGYKSESSSSSPSAVLTRLELSTTLEDDPDFKYERTLARFQCNLTYQYYFIVELRHWPIDSCQRIADLIQEQLTKRCNRAMGSDIILHPSLLPDFPTAVPTRGSFLAEYLSAVFRGSFLHILGHLFLFSLLNIPVTFKSASLSFGCSETLAFITCRARPLALRKPLRLPKAALLLIFRYLMLAVESVARPSNYTFHGTCISSEITPSRGRSLSVELVEEVLRIFAKVFLAPMQDTLEYACNGWARLDWTRNRLLEYHIKCTPRWQAEVMDDKGWEPRQTNT